VSAPVSVPENPFKDWLPHSAWARVQALIKVNKKMSQIVDSFTNFPEVWMEMLNTPEGYAIRLPEPFVIVTPIQRMCILKAIRPGKIPKVIQDFVAQELGEKYIQPPPFSLANSF
jgi:dynein heavy chain